MPSPPTLAYSTHAPGEPIISARPDGKPGIEIDIPPQNQKWRASWPPRTAGSWLAMLFAAAGAAGPFIAIGWWWHTSDRRDALAVVMVAIFIGVFLFGGLAWFFWESGRRRTIILAGPDGLTVTTVGGTAWPKPRHFPRSELKDVVVNPAGRDADGQVVLVLAKGCGVFYALDGTILLPKKQVDEILDRLRDALGMPPVNPKFKTHRK